MAIKSDISKEDVINMVKIINSELGPIDILINNAGITKDNLAFNMKTEEWDDVIGTNLKGTYLCTKYIVRGMMKKKYGKIINIASVVGITGNFGQRKLQCFKGRSNWIYQIYG